MSESSEDRKFTAAILSAIDAYGDRGDGLFTTAQVQHAMKQRGLPHGDQEVNRALLRNPRVVQLTGGSHWLLLPKHFERNMLCVRCGKEPRFKKSNGAHAMLCATCGWNAIVQFCQDEAGDSTTGDASVAGAPESRGQPP